MIIPCIDLMDGKAVQLEQGKTLKIQRDDFDALIDKFRRFGQINVIDLDAAMGKGSNLEKIEYITPKIPSRVGGGIRSVSKALDMLSLGAEKIIVSSAVFSKDGINYSFLEELRTKAGKDKIIIAIDSRNGHITTKGWKENTNFKTEDIIKELEPYCSEFLLTCVENEGLMKGTDFSFIDMIKKKTDNKLSAAGGISTKEEIDKLENIGVNSVIGMAIYSGSLDIDF